MVSRRKLLAGVAAGTLGSVAGCSLLESGGSHGFAAALAEPDPGGRVEQFGELTGAGVEVVTVDLAGLREHSEHLASEGEMIAPNAYAMGLRHAEGVERVDRTTEFSLGASSPDEKYVSGEAGHVAGTYDRERFREVRGLGDDPDDTYRGYDLFTADPESAHALADDSVAMGTLASNRDLETGEWGDESTLRSTREWLVRETIARTEGESSPPDWIDPVAERSRGAHEARLHAQFSSDSPSLVSGFVRRVEGADTRCTYLWAGSAEEGFENRWSRSQARRTLTDAVVFRSDLEPGETEFDPEVEVGDAVGTASVTIPTSAAIF